VADYSSALKLQPKNPMLLYNRGLAYRKVKELTLALADFDRLMVRLRR